MAQLIVALDYTNAEDALATAESLRGCPIWMKVGLELFTHEGPAVVKKLKDMGLDRILFLVFGVCLGGDRLVPQDNAHFFRHKGHRFHLLPGSLCQKCTASAADTGEQIRPGYDPVCRNRELCTMKRSVTMNQ